jgi:hypothetical protein
MYPKVFFKSVSLHSEAAVEYTKHVDNAEPIPCIIRDINEIITNI